MEEMDKRMKMKKKMESERRLRVAKFLGDIRGKFSFLSHKLL